MSLPIPSGWYVVAAASELPPGAVLTRRVGDAERVLFRGADGAPAAVDPVCPHLGAHLGRGGTVVDGALVCPFHGLRFDGQGQCTGTPGGSRPPRRARLVTHPTVETGGWIATWYDPTGRSPDWRPPDLERHRTLRTTALDLRGHPQDVTENSVDLAHFPVVHGYEDVRLESFAEDGPCLRARYSFLKLDGLRFVGRRLRVTIDVQAWGLGFSYVEVTLPDVGMVTQQFVLPTPVGGDRIELRLGMTVARTPAAPLVLRMLPRFVFEGPVGAAAFRSYVSDVLQDRAIWENKAHVERPALIKEDGPIGAYRAWVRQFYPQRTAQAATR